MVKNIKKLFIGMFISLYWIASVNLVHAAQDLQLYDIEETAPTSAVSSINSALYLVTVPEEIEFGDIGSNNFTSKYPITIQFLKTELGDVYIESPVTIMIQSDSNKIEVNSTLKNSGVMDSRSFDSILWIAPENIEQLNKGEYVGNIQYDFAFCADEVYDDSKGEQLSDRSQGIITNGFTSIIKDNPKNEKHSFLLKENNTSWTSSISAALEIEGMISFEQAFSMELLKYNNSVESAVNYLSNVIEVRIPLSPLVPSIGEEYKIVNIGNNTVVELQKLETRPMGEHNFTHGQYFLGIDCVYIYTSEMIDIGIFIGDSEVGTYPPEVEMPEVELDKDEDLNDSVFKPSIDTGKEDDLTTDLEDLESADVDGGDGAYTADVSMRKIVDIYDLSMCDALFFSQADIILEGDLAEITLYVIDPIPSYVDEGTPIIDVVFEYLDIEYPVTLITTNQVAKYFPVASGFITTAGNYYTSKLQVTIPKQAIADSVNGALTCQAYVNAVMKSTQQFYTVFSNLTKGETQDEEDDIITQDEMNSDNSNQYWVLDEDDEDSKKTSTSTPGTALDSTEGTLTDQLEYEDTESPDEELLELISGRIKYALNSSIVMSIVGTITVLFTIFFGYAYYLKRKREEW